MNKTCTKCQNNFTIDSWDETFYAKMKVPAPGVCPDCRFKMRAVWRNEMSLYTGRKCDMCEKNIITMYNPKSPYKVYCNVCYRGDKWNPKDFAKDYDFSRSFFEQLNELIKAVPKSNFFYTSGGGSPVNSDFANCCGGMKNSYMCFNCTNLEDCMYSRGITNSTEVLDSYFGNKLDQSYEAVNCHESAKLCWAKNCRGCVDSYFTENCNGCTNCFGCVNLQNKSNCFLNEQLSKEEYQNKIKEILQSYKNIEDLKKEFQKFSLTFPKRQNNNINIVDGIGDYLKDCKNVKYSFELIDGENTRYNFGSRNIKDSLGTLGFGIKSELLLEVASTGFCSRAIGCWACELSQNLEYCVSCFSNNHDLIGCDSLSNSSYCILNKQYEKEEYEKIREHIVNELTNLGIYGLMLPSELSPFAYNESIANDNMPLTKEEAIGQGYRWEDDIQKTEGKETIQPDEIADNIKDVGDEILDEILKCIDCNRNYKITEQELFFYRKMNLPIPRKCFYCRHKERVEKRGPYKFWERNCANCKKEINTNYAPGRKEIVFCEECYLREVM